MRLALALFADRGRTLDELESRLDENERIAANAYQGNRRRHFAIGRLAAHTALDRLGVSDAGIWIAPGRHGEPVVHSTERDTRIAIAHSGRVGAACAWRNRTTRTRHVGIDIERVRRTDVGQSRYAFSRRERRLVRDAGGSALHAGLFAWVAKEAAWKALRLSPDRGPAAVALTMFDPTHGRAAVVSRDDGTRPASLRVRMRAVAGPDHAYLLAVAIGGSCAESSH